MQGLFAMTKATVSACACNIQCMMCNGGKLSLKAGQNVTITITLVFKLYRIHSMMFTAQLNAVD